MQVIFLQQNHSQPKCCCWNYFCFRFGWCCRW